MSPTHPLQNQVACSKSFDDGQSNVGLRGGFDRHSGRGFLGLNRKTVNRYFGLFRARIALHQAAERGLFHGTVEVDESFFGSSRPRGFTGKLKRGRGTLKQPVFGIIERGSRLYTEIATDTNK